MLGESISTKFLLLRSFPSKLALSQDGFSRNRCWVRDGSEGCTLGVTKCGRSRYGQRAKLNWNASQNSQESSGISSIRVVPWGAETVRPLYDCYKKSLDVVHSLKNLALAAEGLCHWGKSWRSWQLRVLCWQHSLQVGQQCLPWRGFGHPHLHVHCMQVPHTFSR